VETRFIGGNGQAREDLDLLAFACSFGCKPNVILYLSKPKRLASVPTTSHWQRCIVTFVHV
jgi:hypothetical protein